MAGWPKKNEGARLYKVGKNDYRLLFEVQQDPSTDNRRAGTFIGLCPTVTTYDHSKWGVKRDGNGLIRIQYEGVTQDTMGAWSTLCLPGDKGIQAPKATDEQILRAYLGDEHIFTGEKSHPTAHGLHVVKLPSPVTWGGTATRIQWSVLPANWQDGFAAYLDSAPANYRGLWRVDNQPSSNDAPQTAMEV